MKIAKQARDIGDKLTVKTEFQKTIPVLKSLEPLVANYPELGLLIKIATGLNKRVVSGGVKNIIPKLDIVAVLYKSLIASVLPELRLKRAL